MNEDTLINMIVDSFNSEFRTVDVHAYARKNGIIPIEIFDALNVAKHEGLIELKDNDFTTIKLTPFGERVKNAGGWFEYKFLDKSEQKKIKKPKKDKKPKEQIKEVAKETQVKTAVKITGKRIIEIVIGVIIVILGAIALKKLNLG